MPKYRNPFGTYGERSPDQEELSFTLLGAKIVELSAIKGKQNVQQATKKIAIAITVLYKRALEEERNSNENSTTAALTGSQ